MTFALGATATDVRTLAPSALVLAVATVFGSACLPAGNAPVGQHILSDRTLTGVFFAPSGVDGAPSTLLLSGPVRVMAATGGPGFDLYQFPSSPVADPRNGLTGLAPTIDGLVLDQGATPAGYLPRTDSSGRLIYVKAGFLADGTPTTYVARFDFAAGQEQFLALPGASPPAFLVSSTRARVFAERFIFDAAGVTEIGPLSAAKPAFIEDDLYYGTVLYGDTSMEGSSIRRNRADGVDDSLLSTTAVVSFSTIPSDVATQLLVFWDTEAGAIPSMLLDTKRQVSTLVPVQRGGAVFHSASSDGHWLLFSEAGAEGWSRLFLFDWTTNNQPSLVVNDQGSEREWRPGRQELWLPLADGLDIWLSGAPALLGPFNGTARQATFAPDGRRSMFTRDGGHWLSADYRTMGNLVAAALFVGNAEDPSAPPFQLNPWGESLSALWETRDGRLLVGASPLLEASRQDIYLVDPDTGVSRPLASGGYLLAVGQTRVLALLNWQLSSSTGDLTLIDLETGAKTVLAENVYRVVVDSPANPPAEFDPLAQGTPIAFLVRNRLASPYDGLWIARLP